MARRKGNYLKIKAAVIEREDAEESSGEVSQRSGRDELEVFDFRIERTLKTYEANH